MCAQGRGPEPGRPGHLRTPHFVQTPCKSHQSLGGKKRVRPPPCSHPCGDPMGYHVKNAGDTVSPPPRARLCPAADAPLRGGLSSATSREPAADALELSLGGSKRGKGRRVLRALRALPGQPHRTWSSLVKCSLVQPLESAWWVPKDVNRIRARSGHPSPGCPPDGTGAGALHRHRHTRVHRGVTHSDLPRLGTAHTSSSGRWTDKPRSVPTMECVQG